MAKKVTKVLKLQIPGGAAVPGQQLGPVLGAAGINIGEFVKRFNEETKDRRGETVPTVVDVYEDRTYHLTYKTEPAAALILKALKKDKGSGTPNTSKIGTLSKAQVKEIAEKKMSDLNANDADAAMKIIAGTARSMGVEVK
ncbi:MAG: 50S ribosomal protein L11 [Candidatus Zambryskibacteria bacterium RIFCSPLOWO2_02_FULL_51_21]|uniref:Large ribosomal subunit protein uL11 n=1 Tax=Candidatus Zambryskibacteria bacterium RIFCSPHIGHO2_02_FULL_43_37 TaxID=1802749 RepID=A0A1G2TGY1_9BACT|nr:MAG: 50S ribosomal protein L11 [Candidatus Zambryskibacteria bacterium RIFCSPHIGHO2_01_FULL_52_18]OHA96308.1 MAG: 50S ribosomal protein L11 [Candidatus Zambryskibacteria bacterium RIFCSPHIGHO2_02_FULL_43_37]OHB07711.1 MAG: 50S ribosomal protein L11 [Candidatus Zambryskibacteria bacterium RIFCSPLOWO2_01_FULL_52_12]OHB11433.1 MAG: 50S ribosomal protein L11 [Candidatus Zambryskibacteria bacterium RIFCSPLOWO2_02_FULL_51_21]